MKTARRYLAWAIYVVFFVHVLPFAIVKIILDWFFETWVETLDDLKAIIDE